MPNLDFTIPFEPSYPTRSTLVNLTGQTFGRWLVLSIYGRTKYKQTLWLVLCICKQIHVVRSEFLRNKRSQSCGCLHQEKHGRHGTPLYRIYQGAKSRCTNPENQSFKDYGKRGIKFRFESFTEFFAAVGERPSSHLTLERIDNNGHYEASNLYWAPMEKQSRNKRNNRWLTFNDETKCLQDWCELFHIQPATVRYRLDIKHWNIEKALTTPPSR